ncbi:NAD(P)-binding protein [Bimuria novae-zelandiae CBS 107.79]|uniref:NAD(P)-binding protein n=1 Tax=Bimuria novae-zelandiae CBS 107.79 TaxID=1447943 RepID=A0A6A5UIY3_9PLEO|nr:NAD(P)-binding protein [Bimuria novae-zelandiae CBS 107.79]
MSQSTYKSVVLAKRPKSVIVPGETFTLKENPIITEADLEDGHVLVQTLYLSLDPGMRGWLNDVRSYIPPVQIGEVMRGVSIGKVVTSKSPLFAVGDYVSVMSGWAELCTADAEGKDGKSLTKLSTPANGKITDALGVLGMPGLTAYFGLLNVGKVKAGDFVVVSGAAGATGSIVCQIAKLKGAKVLGIVGSDEKAKWLKDLGCDEALNYKDANFVANFKAKTKDKIDVFFDNVGGDVLELAISRAKLYARFVICGAISQYNSAAQSGPKNFSNIVSLRLKMEGFIVFDYSSQYHKALEELAQWLAEGKLQRKETIVSGGLEVADRALAALYKGINTGILFYPRIIKLTG